MLTVTPVENPLRIGLAGLAGCGKDTFYALLRDEIKSIYGESLVPKRYALADELKIEVRDFIISQYGIDILNCTREEKESVRPFLVFHGGFRRVASQGRHWTKIVGEKIKQNNEPIVVVTDVRYDSYEKDEVSWLKNEIGGLLVHISQFSLVPTSRALTYKKTFLSPPNEHEAKFDPLLQEKADYKVVWEKVLNENPEQMLLRLKPYAKHFVEHLVAIGKLPPTKA